MKDKTARLFSNGGSQAVRLPAEFRFDGREVLIRRGTREGEVVLSPAESSTTWAGYLAKRNPSAVPDEFMSDRPLNEQLPQEPFGRRK